MKNLLAYFIPAFVFLSCNNDGTVEAKAVAVPAVSIKTNTRTITKIDTLNENSRVIKKATKPLLIARGSEPGWYAEFFADHLHLLIDNGTDSLMAENDFSKINQQNFYHVTLVKNALKGSFILDISIKNKNCTEEGSGESREKSISIKYNNKTYKGCATAK